MDSEKNDARREIDKQVSFALYSVTNRMIRLHKPILEPLGLTFPQYLVIVELLESAPRSVGDLGARVGMDTGTITPLLKRLEQAGMVTRRRDPGDERRVLVDLTAAGAALREPIAAIPQQINVACRITDAQASELHRVLEAMEHSRTG